MDPKARSSFGGENSFLGERPEETHGVQLSKLSSVLNGLETGATAMRLQAQHLMRAVRSGTYCVDPINLSKRIVRDSLGAA